MENADQIEFQRLHRVGKRVSSNGKPRQIIARFLKYPQREEVMSNARKLKGKRQNAFVKGRSYSTQLERLTIL